MTDLQPIIETAYESRSNLSPQSKEPRLRDAINQTLAALEEGTLRVAELTNGQWKVNQWIKKAEAVVISDKQTALYEPRASATPYFEVPEGSIVFLEDEFDAWVKISAGDKSGWLAKSSIERVYPWINVTKE